MQATGRSSWTRRRATLQGKKQSDHWRNSPNALACHEPGQSHEQDIPPQRLRCPEILCQVRIDPSECLPLICKHSKIGR
jgi:hypothetical protein